MISDNAIAMMAIQIVARTPLIGAIATIRSHASMPQSAIVAAIALTCSGSMNMPPASL